MTVIQNPAPHAAGPQGPTGQIINVSMGAGGVMSGPMGAVGVMGGGGGGFSFHPTSTAKSVTSLSIHGQPVPEGEKFGAALDLFLLDVRIDDNEVSHFHFLVWTKLFGDEFPDYGTVMRSDRGISPAFGSKESRAHYVEWFAEYERKFYKNHDIATTKAPLPRSGDIKGVWVEDRAEGSLDMVSFRPSGVRENLIDWAWIVGNCHNPVTRMANGWLFESDTDAIHFKMR